MNAIKKAVQYRTSQAVLDEAGAVTGFKEVTKTIEFETGELARQANAVVRVTCGGSSVLCAVTVRPQELPAIPEEAMTPLMVDYRERTYAAGRIPGGFFKREGRPREHEIHCSRYIDRTIRPLFPKESCRDVQVQCIVQSFDPEHDPGTLAVLGASAALTISDIPFNGPVGYARLGRVNGTVLLNPSFQERGLADMDLAVSFVNDRTLMIEMESSEISEDEVLRGIEHLRGVAQQLVEAQQALREACGKPKFAFKKQFDLDGLIARNRPALEQKMLEAMRHPDRAQHSAASEAIKALIELPADLVSPEVAADPVKMDQLRARVFFEVFRAVARTEVAVNGKRPDGRTFDQLREITCRTGILPRTHGSAVFQRGQTQALVAVTLGTSADQQIMDELVGEYKERFMFHYNFPGFATGEVRPERGVSRREMGHGFLAKKALEAVIPPESGFPYTIRVVSDILESNGSSSMASVCGGSLALFDAGVPLTAAVAGIAIGLMYEQGRYTVLTDIAGLEDHIGDMDFKIAGTATGITAIQLDMKIDGIPLEVVGEALRRGRTARLRVLEIMNAAVSSPRPKLSPYAPKLSIVQIPVERIGELIGPGGKNIKQIIEKTKAEIDINDDGRVFISSESQEAVDAAVAWIEGYAKEVEAGKTYTGEVVKIIECGAIVEILPGKTGLLHISEIAEQRIKKVEDVLKLGDTVTVKVMEVSPEGKYRLSRKRVLKEASHGKDEQR